MFPIICIFLSITYFNNKLNPLKKQNNWKTMNEVSLKISFTNAAFEITISEFCLTPRCLLRSLINVTCICLLAGHVLIVYILYSVTLTRQFMITV